MRTVGKTSKFLVLRAKENRFFPYSVLSARNRVQLKKALERSLDVLGEPSKKSLLLFLEEEYDISFRENDCSRVEEIEAALGSILGEGARIITNEIHRNLERNAGRSTGKKHLVRRESKSLI